MVTTLGSYATAPNQIVRLIVLFRQGFVLVLVVVLESGRAERWSIGVAECWSNGRLVCCARILYKSFDLKQRNTQNRLSNKFLQDITGWRHHRAGMSISEQPFDAQPFRER